MENLLGLSPERLYDEMRTHKVYCRPGMGCYAEFVEGIPRGTRQQISTKNSFAKRLDEWATDHALSVSELIHSVGRAALATKRKQMAADELESYRCSVVPEEETEVPVKQEAKTADKPVAARAEKPEPILYCPRCGAPLKLRSGVHGEFYGCTGYPNCRGTLSVKQVAAGQGREPPKLPPTTYDQSSNRWEQAPKWLPWFGLIVAGCLLAMSKGTGDLRFWVGILVGLVFAFKLISELPPRHNTARPARPPKDIYMSDSVLLDGNARKQMHQNYAALTSPTPDLSPAEAWNQRLHSWRFWLVVGSILMSLMGMVGFAEFMYEEAVQQAGFGCFILKSAGLAEEAFEQVERLNRMVNSMERFTHALGWISPFNWQAYKMFIEGARQNADAVKLWAISQNPMLAENVLSSKVVAVLDGDSLMLATGEEIRLAGIDAPEWYEDGGHEATQFLKGLALRKTVTIKRLETGYYGRVIADLSIGGDDVATLLCQAGLATPVTPTKVAAVDGGEGVVTRIEAAKELDGGYLLLTGIPVDVFILPEAAKGFDGIGLIGATVEAIGKLKLYRGSPEVIVDDIDNLRIIDTR